MYSEQVVAYALSRRPNVKLVETGLPFGKEGFTNFMGKAFDPSLKLTRRFYPHSYNIDGFYVAKFKKIGPTPANAILAPDKKAKGASATEESSAAENLADKTPIAEDKEGEDGKGDDFGGFDDDEDDLYLERAKRNAMRRRGLDPKALNRKAPEKESNGKGKGPASSKKPKPKSK